MDSRRLQELRDVYTQLSHQSTGPDGAHAAVGAAGAGGAGGAAAAVAPPDLLDGRRNLGVLPSPPLQAITDPVVAGAAGITASGTNSFIVSLSRHNKSSGSAPEPLVKGPGQPSSLPMPMSKGQASATLAAAAVASSAAALNALSNRHINSSSSLPPPSSNNSTAERYHRRQLLLAGAMTGVGMFGRSSSSSSHTTTSTTQDGGAGAAATAAAALTTEHIKSRLQKYRLHAHRSKDEFLEFFNLRLEDKFTDFLQTEGWRKLPPDHGCGGHQDESEYDSSGGGDGAGGEGAGGGGGGDIALAMYRLKLFPLGAGIPRETEGRLRLTPGWAGWATSATWVHNACGSSSTSKKCCGCTSRRSSSSRRRYTSTSPPPLRLRLPLRPRAGLAAAAAAAGVQQQVRRRA
ncbi:unnamed protein product [Pylaiella littoralis]